MRAGVASSIASLLASCALAGCAPAERSQPVTARASALTLALAPVADTFINSVDPDNNDGASLSFFTGQNGQGGVMRGLLKFELPAALAARVTVTRVTLTLTAEGLGMGTTPPTPATESLQALQAAWTEGTGFGNTTSAYTVGQACGTTGATWNNSDCTAGTPWAGAGAVAAVSGTASVPASIETVVTWDSAEAANAGLVADVQSWLDAPATNQGWRISSSTEAMNAAAQRFYSRETPGKGPLLTVTATCKPELADAAICAALDAGAPDAGGQGGGGTAGAGTGGAGGVNASGSGGAGGVDASGRGGAGGVNASGSGGAGGVGGAGTAAPPPSGDGCACAVQARPAGPKLPDWVVLALLVALSPRRGQR